MWVDLFGKVQKPQTMQEYKDKMMDQYKKQKIDSYQSKDCFPGPNEWTESAKEEKTLLENFEKDFEEKYGLEFEDLIKVLKKQNPLLVL